MLTSTTDTGDGEWRGSSTHDEQCTYQRGCEERAAEASDGYPTAEPGGWLYKGNNDLVVRVVGGVAVAALGLIDGGQRMFILTYGSRSWAPPP
ncbi:hypothetical protein CYMTET_27314 [Cymbomonas tetramitiformis]|uniref:Uncharacterized protein n=1 Tax=Cymbomonas tetramitiformis TaxID=36881 RepID=A0AAE0KXC5_9CHLO|nr:hypothetical protein CYMTET_27314 [Cymbomonas tetramitiformis]